ncbi:MAG TPA: RICIN domain-containing protein [Streptosporangiaceae bacterium]|nr:RICIN domain-containing protein [Streptosporangiaceae bacterium]
MEHHLTIRHARPLVSILAALALGAAAVGTAVPAAAATTTLVVNVNQPFRAVTHVASGALYGLDTGSIPADSLVEPLRPNTFVQMAPGGKQLPNGEPAPGGDSLVVAHEAATAGAKVVVRMPDWYPTFPYQWVSWSNWLSAVDTQVKAVLASGDSNISAFELWNEPDGTWNTTAAGPFDAGWARTFNEVRSLDPSAPIQGPSISHFSSSFMTTFLTDAKASGTVPNIISWHELGGSASIAADVSSYRSIEKSLGIGPLPIAIEEYGEPSEVGIPGPLAGYIAKFERAGVNNAELAFWNHYGTLGDTLTDTGGAPNAAYWLYRWYGSMTGNMVTTVPPSQTGLDGAASVNAAGNQVSVIFGGGSGSVAVTVNGLSSTFGSTAHVVLEQTVSAGRTTAAVGPVIISSSNLTVTNGSITVPISAMNAANGYHLLITPGTSPPLSGSFVIKNSHSGLVLGTQGNGTAQGTLAVQATASGGSTQTWTLVSEGSNFYEIQNSASGQVLGITNEGVTAGGDALIWGNNGTSDHLWQLISQGNGQYKIENYNSGLVLGVQNESTASGAQILQWTDNGTPDHLWTLTAS